MTAKELFDAGRLAEAIDALIAGVRDRPTDLPARTFLFEALCFSGDFARAGRQLDAIARLSESPESALGARLYRSLLEAERDRGRLFDEGVRPRFPLEPPPGVTLHLDALDLIRRGEADVARERLDEAGATSRPLAGAVDGAAFDDIRDADDILGPALEVFAASGYCWVPWGEIQYLEVAPPRGLRDLLWAPARLALFDGQLGEVHLPTLYPRSHGHPDDAVRLGRATDWAEGPGGIVRGLGLKTLLVGEEARTLRGPIELRLLGPDGDSPPDSSMADG